MDNLNLVYYQDDLILSILDLPLEIKQPRSILRINFNVLMRAHHRKVTKVKNLFQEIVEDKLPPSMETYTGQFKILFVYYRPTLHRRDLSNMCAWIDKHTTDMIVKAGYIKDDDVNIIGDVHYHYGGLRKKRHFIDVYLFKK